ncbi:hypothetical protein [Streptomyces sp. NBC_00829]|uniref:hypothetical protein n=1 Tax=Streptomyces sp. NBC_00829 TaxID=2903679 RepID=UPI003862F218|nr:hypothetical protein OG293_24940 [Streptomyces sp. NBC_00829]
MRTTARLLASTVLAAATIGIGAPLATAEDYASLEVFPSTAVAGTFITVSITVCGHQGLGIGDARSLGAGEFQLLPGTHNGVAIGQFTVPANTQPGTYVIGVRCKNGRQATGEVVVRHHGRPSGHVDTGVGGSVGPDTTQIAAGVAVLAAAAVGGTLLLRRRASGAQDS